MTAFAGPATRQSENHPSRSTYPTSLVLNEATDQLPGTKFLDELRTQGFFPILIFVPRPVNGEATLSPFTDADQTSTSLQLAANASPATDSRDVFVFGEVTVNIRGMEVWRRGTSVFLRRKEFKTLVYLIQNAGRVVSRDELLNEVWGYQSYPCTRTVDNHILRLRSKLEIDPTHPRHFQTVHGTGYKFLPQI